MTSLPARARASRRPRLVGALIVGVALLVTGAVVAPTSGRALEAVASGYPAGDFETTGLTPQGWTVSAPSPNRAVVSSSRAISGSRSLLVDDASTIASVSVTRPRFAVTPGVAYFAQGYAYTTRGAQSLGLLFYDAAGARITSSTSATTATSGAVMVWSRTEAHAVAPSTARYATIQLSSSTAALSQVWWDAVAVIAPTLTNPSLESAPTTSAPVPGWVPSYSGGATVRLSTAAKSGTRSVELVDASTTGAATVTSSLVPVFAAATHDVRLWVRPTTGSFTLNVRWYDASRRLVSVRAVPVSKPAGVWSLVAVQATAPVSAQFAALQLATSVAGRSTGAWDLASVLPTNGAAVRAYASRDDGEPLDAFSNSNTSAVAVIGGRAKLFTLIAGYPAEFQLADLETGRVEQRIPAPGMDVGWTVTNGHDGNIYFGGSGGHLWRYLPASQKVEDLGPATSSATTVWDLETGPDGRIWGVSYPAAELWSYAPATGTITSRGSVAAGHEYARSVAVDDAYAYVGVGSANPTVVRVDLADPTSTTEIPLPTPVTSGNVTEMEKLGRYLVVRAPSGVTATGAQYSGERRLYDTVTGSWDVEANMAAQSPSGLDSAGRFFYLSYKQLWAVDSATGTKTALAPTALSAGRDRPVLRATLGGVSGEWLLAFDGVGTVQAINLSTYEERAYAVDFLATKMKIKALGAGPTGTVIAGGFGGSSLSVVRTDTGARQQYPAVSTGSAVIGEVEGTIAHGTTQYIGTYTDGKVFRYDTTKPWVDGSNPALIVTLGTSHRQDRPIAWATAGARTFFGTVPKYGVLGGALGIIDSDTATPVVVSAPVSGQSVVGLAASGNVVYGSTTRWGGLGATPTQTSAKVFAYDASTRRKLWESTPLPGAESIGAVAIGPGGSVWAASGPLLVELDPRTGALRRRVMIYPAPATTGAVYKNADLAYLDGVFYLAAMDRVYVVDPATLRVTAAVPSGLSTPRLAVSGSRVYYPSGTMLRSVNR